MKKVGPETGYVQISFDGLVKKREGCRVVGYVYDILRWKFKGLKGWINVVGNLKITAESLCGMFKPCS